MKEKPKLLSSKTIHEGWLKLKLDKLKLPSIKKLYLYEVVQIGDGVAVLPFIDNNTLLLAKQYRHPVGEYLLELIQGGIKRNESIKETAQRELLEETGYTGKLEYINTMYPLPGSLDMRLHIMEATQLQKIQEPKLDITENLEIVKVPYDQVLNEVLSGKHKDSALELAILYHKVRSYQHISKNANPSRY